jgi:hypothetical protein
MCVAAPVVTSLISATFHLLLGILPHRRGGYNAALRVARPRTAERIGQATAWP